MPKEEHSSLIAQLKSKFGKDDMPPIPFAMATMLLLPGVAIGFIGNTGRWLWLSTIGMVVLCAVFVGIASSRLGFIPSFELWPQLQQMSAAEAHDAVFGAIVWLVPITLLAQYGAGLLFRHAYRNSAKGLSHAIVGTLLIVVPSFGFMQLHHRIGVLEGVTLGTLDAYTTTITAVRELTPKGSQTVDKDVIDFAMMQSMKNAVDRGGEGSFSLDQTGYSAWKVFWAEETR